MMTERRHCGDYTAEHHVWIPHESAAGAIQRNLQDCRALLDWIGLECDRIEEAGATWSAVGTAAAIRERLLATLDGMNGMTQGTLGHLNWFYNQRN